MNLQYVAVIKDSQIVGTPSEIADHMVLYYTNGLCCPLSDVCHTTGRRRKGKGLEVPGKYNYYCGPTKDLTLIRHPEFIFVITRFPLATKQDQAFIQDRP